MIVPGASYILSEVAERWGRPLRDILKLAEAGHLTISIRVNRYCRVEDHGSNAMYETYRDRGTVHPGDAWGFIANELCELKSFIGRDGVERTFMEEGITVKRAIGGTERKPYPSPVLYNRESLFITQEEYSRITNDFPDLVINKGDTGKTAAAKSGPKKSSLTKAVEFVYAKAKEEGNTSILKKGYVSEFIKEMHRVQLSKHDPVANEIFEGIRIRSVFGRWMIYIGEKVLECTEKKEVTAKSRSYRQESVSQILNRLRSREIHPM
jgi:hypothetical protein